MKKEEAEGGERQDMRECEEKEKGYKGGKGEDEKQEGRYEGVEAAVRAPPK